MNISNFCHTCKVIKPFLSTSGATKPQYAPEPFDVGKNLHVEIVLGDKKILLTTTGPIDPGM